MTFKNKKRGREHKFYTPPDSQCPCGKAGKPRVDHGLAAGVHCDECWEKMVSICRSRSW